MTKYAGSTAMRVATTGLDPIIGGTASMTTPEGVIHYDYNPATGSFELFEQDYTLLCQQRERGESAALEE